MSFLGFLLLAPSIIPRFKGRWLFFLLIIYELSGLAGKPDVNSSGAVTIRTFAPAIISLPL
jgi:hypothetical protein